MLFWVVPILFIVIGEVELFPVGLFADNVRLTSIFETIAILITASCIPLSLKLLSLVLAKKIGQLALDDALKCYLLWSIFRLGLLEVVVLLNLISYYLTLSKTGALCALIALTASLFCLPSEKRLREDLHITHE